MFERVKEALCGELLLFTPNFSLPFNLQTDASDRGLGAVLTHISRKLSQQEARYSTVEKECLPIRWVPPLLTAGSPIHPLFGPCPPPVAPPHEEYQGPNHLVVFGLTAL